MVEAYLVGINYDRKENKKILKHLHRGRGMQISKYLPLESARLSPRRKTEIQTGYLNRAAVPP